jgi:threonine dehydrogenase-like Zn-dependent dehydrogenase
VRAFVLSGPGRGAVEQVPAPVAGRGQVVVDVERVGVCGTDAECYTGEMTYLRTGEETYPLRLGHEWCGTVTATGEDVDPTWRGRRVTGDTMIGCGHCRRCRRGVQHLCADRFEIGLRGGFPGALAEQLAVPASHLHALPDGTDPALGALVEPGGNALRCAVAAGVGPGDRVLVAGPGTIGLLVALFARARGAEVHVLGVTADTLGFARGLGFGAWTDQDLPAVPFDAVVDASGAASVPARVVDLVEPGGRVVLVGLSPGASVVDSRTLVLKDLTAVGVLSASPALADVVEVYASGDVDPLPLVGATVGLGGVADVLAGRRPVGTASAPVGPKVHVDPRR